MSSDKGKPAKLPWIPPRFETAELDLATHGHAYYDLDDASTPGTRVSQNIGPSHGVDQDNPS